MNLVLFTHPEFIGSRSQDRFAAMLLEALESRGHTAQLRRPTGHLHGLMRSLAPTAGGLAKWAGYLDQYLFFAAVLRWRSRSDPAHTLYVFCDQALGPWVPALVHRPHVVHCHDLLALRSALGEVPENPTSWTGRAYQRYIRRGFRAARHFVSISAHTRAELHRVGGVRPLVSEVVHNGLNHPYAPLERAVARERWQRAGVALGDEPYLLHVGGGQWYKNTRGVLALYARLARRRAAASKALPLLVIVGDDRDAAREAAPGGWLADLPVGARVVVARDLPAAVLQALYSSAEALLFPSLAEGYGWPIAEALACGGAVVTTGEPPMTEVGGEVAVYLPRLTSPEAMPAWADAGAVAVDRLLQRDAAQRASDRAAALAWARRFEPQRAIDGYLHVYRQVLAHYAASRQRERWA
jgi:glycosyltransferase involved in cell wall biosynthesis